MLKRVCHTQLNAARDHAAQRKQAHRPARARAHRHSNEGHGNKGREHRNARENGVVERCGGVPPPAADAEAEEGPLEEVRSEHERIGLAKVSGWVG